MHTYNFPFDEEKVRTSQEALRNYFKINKLEYVEDEIQGESGWSWISVIAAERKKNGKLKKYLTTLAITKLSDAQLQVTLGTRIKASDILTPIGAGLPLLLLSPLGALIAVGFIGGVFVTTSLTSKRRHVEKTIRDILKLHLASKGDSNE